MTNRCFLFLAALLLSACDVEESRVAFTVHDLEKSNDAFSATLDFSDLKGDVEKEVNDTVELLCEGKAVCNLAFTGKINGYYDQDNEAKVLHLKFVEAERITGSS